MSHIGDFNFYAEAVTRASERTRGAFFLMVILSSGLLVILLDCAVFNWLTARSDFYQWYKEAHPKYQAYIIPGSPDKSVKIYLTAHPRASEKEIDDVQRLAKWPKDMPLTSDGIDKRLIQLGEDNVQQSRMSLPLIGHEVDLNNLTLLAGYTILFCFLMLKLCLRRELATLRTAKDVAHEMYGNSKEQVSLQACRDLLCMGQVLINPQPGISSAERVFFVLLFMPPIVVALQVWSDWQTKDIGLVIKPAYTIWLIALGAICLLCCLAVSIASVNISRAINGFWNAWPDVSPSGHR
jgi:hypothetical protein